MIEIKQYSDWYFIVSGDVIKYNKELKEMGGQWNSRECEWIFNITKKNIIENWFNDLNKTENENQKVFNENEKVFKKIEIIENKIFEDFCDYLSLKINKKDIDSVLDYYVKNNYYNFHEYDDGYFDNEVINMIKFFYDFICTVEYSIPHSVYQKIDIKKMIEHALISIKRV
jgi:hypothetical protein